MTDSRNGGVKTSVLKEQIDEIVRSFTDVKDRPECAAPDDPATVGAILRVPDGPGLPLDPCAVVANVDMDAATVELHPISCFPAEDDIGHRLDTEIDWRDSPLAAVDAHGNFCVRRWHTLTISLDAARNMLALARFPEVQNWPPVPDLGDVRPIDLAPEQVKAWEAVVAVIEGS